MVVCGSGVANIHESSVAQDMKKMLRRGHGVRPDPLPLSWRQKEPGGGGEEGWRIDNKDSMTAKLFGKLL